MLEGDDDYILSQKVLWETSIIRTSPLLKRAKVTTKYLLVSKAYVASISKAPNVIGTSIPSGPQVLRDSLDLPTRSIVMTFPPPTHVEAHYQAPSSRHSMWGRRYTGYSAIHTFCTP